jgi:HD-GYP domain-containing protein (c-di-GMP phosphodiesterase class II)
VSTEKLRLHSKGEDQILEVFPISPYLILPATKGQFTVYLKQNNKLVLYTRKDEAFTREHRATLSEMGVRQVFVLSDERTSFEDYVLRNLAPILEDDLIPHAVRSGAWYQASLSLAQSVFDEKLPKPMNRKRFSRVQALIKATVDSLQDARALKQMAAFIARGFALHHHSVGTMVLTVSVLQHAEEVDDTLLVDCGTGAFLHDIGKVRLPKAVLEARSENLSEVDREQVRTHPALGVSLCAGIDLPHAALNCILFHHEREDGSGYPAGVFGQDVPYYVKALAVCNVYDNLTRSTPDRPAYTPYKALEHIKSRKEQYDLPMLKRLIGVLADAEIT